jgi:hypothetical protein
MIAFGFLGQALYIFEQALAPEILNRFRKFFSRNHHLVARCQTGNQLQDSFVGDIVSTRKLYIGNDIFFGYVIAELSSILCVEVASGSQEEQDYKKAFFHFKISGRYLLTGFTKPPFSSLKIKDGLVQVFSSEVGPQLFRKM